MLRGWRVRRALRMPQIKEMTSLIKSEEGIRRKVKVLNLIL